MNFLIVAYWHDRRFKKKAGGLIRIFSLADNLLELGHEAHLILPKLGFPQNQTRASVDEIPFIDLPILRPLTFHLLSTLTVFFRCLGGVQVVYVRQMNSFLQLFIARLMGAYTFFEIPNDPYLAYALYSPVKRVFVRCIDQLCFHLAHRLVVLSEWTKKRIITLGHIKDKKIVVFPSGTDTHLFSPKEKKLSCTHLGLDYHNFYIGFIGSFLPYQGVDTIIEAAPHILAAERNTRFLFVGDGPMRETWERKVIEKGLEKYFIFRGQVPYDEVPEYLGVMDICVAPHRKESNQSSPVKIFDYMAAGKPVVASDIEAVREIVGVNELALLAEPDDPKDFAAKIIMLLRNENLREEIGNKARAYAVEHFDRKKLTAQVFSHL